MAPKAFKGNPILHSSLGPNPRLVKVFMKEKGITVPTVEVDLVGGENRREPYLSKNPSGQSPSLEIDDGVFIAEITVICEYLNEIFPGNGIELIGKTPEERAITRMWLRRIDYKLDETIINGFRFAEGRKFFEKRLRVIPQAADDLKLLAQENMMWFDKQLSDGRKYLAGNRLTLADFWMYICLDFGVSRRQPINPQAKHLLKWFEAMKARDSIKSVL